MKFTKKQLVEMSPEEFDLVARAFHLHSIFDCARFKMEAISSPECERQTRAFIKRLQAKKKSGAKVGRLKSQVQKPKQPHRQTRKHAP